MLILHYIPSLNREAGGTAAYMQLLAKELGRSVELHVAVGDDLRTALPLERCTTHSLGGGTRLWHRWPRLLDKLRPDVVHVNTCWLPSCALVQSMAQRRGYPVVLSPHGMLEPWIVARHYLTRKLPALLLYQRAAVRQAERLHATADTERDNLLRLGYNSRVTVVPNGIDPGDVAMKSSWQCRRELLFLARVHVKKGVNHLIEAVAQLRHELQGYTVRIAGEGDAAYVDSLRRLSAQLGTDDIVTFEGGVYGERKWQLMRQADLFVLPTYSENFGIVVAEALAAGTPVITTVGTPWHDLTTHGCGWLTDTGTAPLVAALRQALMLTAADRERMGRAGRRLVEQHYSAQGMAQAMVRLYHSVLTDRH